MNAFGEATGKSTLTIQSVPQDQWPELFAWVDPMKDAAAVEQAVAEFERRLQLHSHSPVPLEARIGNERVAAAYMMLLGARVAALAGVRGADNHTVSAASLLTELVQQVRAAGIVQIQAILDGTESIAEDVVELAGFIALAELQQMALPLPANPGNTTIEPAQLPEGLHWMAAREISRAKLVQLIAHTFIETLDCPAINGLRTPDDVLEGFLDGQTLGSQSSWWILASGDKLLGCSFVNSLSSGAAELVYMGLGVTSRGRGYGKLLLEQAIRSALELKANTFLAAVDCDNWPAIRLYTQAGLQEHARVQAWFYRENTN